MNGTDRLVSPANTSKLEFTYNKPIASSDLNESQVVKVYNAAVQSYLNGPQAQIYWTVGSTANSVKINAFSISIVNISSTGEIKTLIFTGNPNLIPEIEVPCTSVSSNSKYKLNMFIRTREVNSESQLYANGIRTNNICTIANGDTPIENVVKDPYLEEEVSTRVVYEYTFTLTPISAAIATPVASDGIAWTPITTYLENQGSSLPYEFTVDLSYEAGVIGCINNTGTMVVDYALAIGSTVADLPSVQSGTTAYAYDLNTSDLYYTVENSWIKIDNLASQLFRLNSFIRVNSFVDVNGAINHRSGYIYWNNAKGYLDRDLILDAINIDDVKDLQSKVALLESRTTDLMTKVNKAFQWRGLSSSSDSLDDYRTVDHIGFWNSIASESTPKDIPISRASNEVLTILVWGTPSTSITTGYCQEIYYTSQNRMFKRYYASSTWSSWEEIYSGNSVAGFDISTFLRFKGSLQNVGEITDMNITPDDTNAFGIWVAYNGSSRPTNLPSTLTSSTDTLIIEIIPTSVNNVIEKVTSTYTNVRYERVYDSKNAAWSPWYTIPILALDQSLITKLKDTSFTGTKIPVINSDDVVSESDTDIDKINLQNGKNIYIPDSRYFTYGDSGWSRSSSDTICQLDSAYMCALCCWNGMDPWKPYYTDSSGTDLNGNAPPSSDITNSNSRISLLELGNGDNTRDLKCTSGNFIAGVNGSFVYSDTGTITSTLNLFKGLSITKKAGSNYITSNQSYEFRFTLTRAAVLSSTVVLSLWNGKVNVRINNNSVGLLIYNANKNSQLVNSYPFPIDLNIPHTYILTIGNSGDVSECYIILKDDTATSALSWTVNYALGEVESAETFTIPQNAQLWAFGEAMITTDYYEPQYWYGIINDGEYAERNLVHRVMNGGVLAQLTKKWFNSLPSAPTIVQSQTTLTGNEPAGTLQFVVSPPSS